MDRLHELPPRSASMPSPGTELPVGRFQPFARKSISRRDSEMVLSEGPITLPMSPGPDEHLQQQMLSQQDVPVVDAPQPSDATYPMTPSSQMSDTQDIEDEMDIVQDDTVEMQVEQTHTPPPQPPEQGDVQGTRSLRLTDFDVRGTLGALF